MSLHTWDTAPISIEGPQGWDNTRVAVRGEKYCPWWLTYLKPGTGEVFDYGKPCRSFTHRPCAEKRVHDLLDHIGNYILRSRSEFWVATGQYDDGLAGRMRVRRNKVKSQSAEILNAFWVRRDTDAVYYFSTEATPGASSPQDGMWTPSSSAFVVAKAALTLPGVGDLEGRKGVNFTSAWRPVGQERKSSGLVRLTQQRPAASRIVTEAAGRLGSGPPRSAQWGSGWAPPHGVELDDWRRTVEEVGDEIEAERG
jgi:hypothetical protein